MRQGQDISAHFPGVLIIHQKITGSRITEHNHAEHEIFLPLQGEIEIAIGQGTLKAGPGRMIYLPAQTPHSFSASRNSSGERLILLVEKAAWNRRQCGAFSPKVIPISQLLKELAFHLLLHPKTRAA